MAYIESVVLSDNTQNINGQLNLIGVRNTLIFNELPTKYSFKISIFLSNLDSSSSYVLETVMRKPNKHENLFTSSLTIETKDKSKKETGLKGIITLNANEQEFNEPGEYIIHNTIIDLSDKKNDSHFTVVPVIEREVKSL